MKTKLLNNNENKKIREKINNYITENNINPHDDATELILKMQKEGLISYCWFKNF